MSQGLVFITGATGFIGAQVLNVTLKAGYRVRISVRKESQVNELKLIWPSYVDQMDFVTITDITSPNAFSQALNGVDFIFHLASPMPGTGADVRKDYVEPAVLGTESMLRAASSTPSIKRVVLMASILSLMPMGGLAMEDLVVKENSDEPNPVNLDMQFPEGFDGQGLKYQASKILAHQATKRFMMEQKPHFTIITLHPTFVLGPSLVQKSVDDATGIVGLFLQTLGSEKPLFPPNIVHVGDVADATLASISANVEGKGTEFIISGPKFGWDDVVSYVKANYPTWPINLQPPFDQHLRMILDTSHAEKVLGMKWRSMEDIVSGVLDQQLALRMRSE